MIESLNSKIGLDLIAIDECHCVSQWGNDFRPDYRAIGSRLRDRLPNTPFIALTATATPHVRRDIVKSLHLNNPAIHVTSFNRYIYLNRLSQNCLIKSTFLIKKDQIYICR